MHLDNLTKAVELQTQLKLWQEALSRCNQGIFKGAALRVFTAAHGHQGQKAETIINLDAEHVKPLAESHIDRIQGELRGIGVDI